MNRIRLFTRCIVVFLLVVNINMAQSSESANCSSTIYRFIEGQDSQPTVMAPEEKTKELNDVFAKSILCSGLPAASLKQITTHLDNPSHDFVKKQYVVAEGGQIPVSTAIPSSASLRNMRYTVSWADVHGTPMVFGSSSPPSDNTSNFLQVIAFDESKQRFNFYERFDYPRTDYFWAGDSSWARKKKTIGVGCFDCHHNGVPIMKELKIPWNNWSSERANITNSIVSLKIQNDPPFKNRIGAQELEPTIKGASSKYYPNFIRSHINDNFTQITNVSELLRFVIETTTVNLESTNPLPGNANTFAFPKDFWIADSILRGPLIGLDYNIPQGLMFSVDNYKKFLKTTDSRLVQCSLKGATKSACVEPPQFTVLGSTHFAGFTPVLGNEDVLMSNLLIRVGIERKLLKLISPKFITAILMVDFQNPIFSQKRNSLIQYAKAVGTATIANNSSNMASLVASKITTASSQQEKCNDITLDTCTAEQQFLFVWEDANWKANTEKRINAYFQAIDKNISCTTESCTGQDEYLKLLVSQHRQMAATTPLGNLVEFSLLFPFSSLPISPFLRMNVVGKVVASD
ncbi:MAG TPA: hypothetical protein ENH88_22860 [Pseudoalteromonas prydzensis]|uniref:Uncharacterized protein n=1 Tax=Pseudoalteromonas prydzensis TaxID=182141 RepID=A0A7V1D3J5_9GAMM|nr:hypothetical protein [Pseudoalteromonas prydzensis]HEA19240.1 hypothetical protein [Pseudoalteromonas prydzensis]